MKLKSPNVWFIFGTVPVLVLDFVLGAWFARGMVWLSVVLLLLGLLAAVALVRKFIVMPKPRNRYGTPEPFALELPINCNAEFYHCPEMAKYEFLHRTVEVVSPLWNGKKPFQVMINPTLAEKYGQDFEKVAVVRELENFRRKNSLKSLVGLLLPVEVLAAAVPAAVAFGPQLEAVLGSFVLYFAAPFAAVAAFGGCLYLWNRTISIQDKQLDAFLLGYFSKEQVKQYIQVTEKMNAEGGSEKSRVFTEHYRDDRCCFSKRMRNFFRKNEKSVLQFCNKKPKRKGRLQRVEKSL